MATISAPKLPIQNRSTISPPSRPGGTTKSPIGPNRRERRQDCKARWADYTPTWHDSSSPWPDGYPGPLMFLQTPPGPEREREAAQLWPATPTPSGGGTGYGFGVMERQEHGESGPFLQPPARVAQMAAAAAHAAAAAGAAAQAAAAGNKASSKERRKGLGNTLQPPSRLNLTLESLDAEEEPPLDEANAQWKEQEVSAVSTVPSKGSSTHGNGKCRPCAWFWKPQGCQNDQDCGYCHLCPEGELKNRKKSKVAAMRMGALVPAKSQKAKFPSGARVLKLSPLL